MKRKLFFLACVVATMGLCSWGYQGHYIVGAIAEKHLTPAAQAAVKNLLGHRSMADVSSYADEIKSDPAFRSTAELHYLNIPMGYTYDEFSTFIKGDKKANIYTAIIGFAHQLEDPKAGKAAKELALQFLIHLVGDAHQPMHVSRVEDKGGNGISVTFLNSPTNLHSLWDSGLIEHQKINYKDLAAKYDDATPQQIAKWQSDSIMLWLWESYQVTTILYQEAAANPDFDEKYYQEHIPIVKNRIEKAGIRLAGVLNTIYK